MLVPIPAYSLGRSRSTSAATRVLTFWLAASISAWIFGDFGGEFTAERGAVELEQVP